MAMSMAPHSVSSDMSRGSTMTSQGTMASHRKSEQTKSELTYLASIPTKQTRLPAHLLGFCARFVSIFEEHGHSRGSTYEPARTTVTRSVFGTTLTCFHSPQPTTATNNTRTWRITVIKFDRDPDGDPGRSVSEGRSMQQWKCCVEERTAAVNQALCNDETSWLAMSKNHQLVPSKLCPMLPSLSDGGLRPAQNWIFLTWTETKTSGHRSS